MVSCCDQATVILDSFAYRKPTWDNASYPPSIGLSTMQNDHHLRDVEIGDLILVSTGRKALSDCT